MADGAVQVLLGKLLSLYEEESSLLGGVRHKFNEIKLELESMRSFLKDADRREESDAGVRSWVEQVRNVVYDIEDIIDEYSMFHTESILNSTGFTGFFRKTIQLPMNVWTRHSIATKLQIINTQVESISERSKRYGFDRLEDQVMPSHGVSARESSFFIEDDELVGTEEKENLLLRWLMDGERRRTVIPVCGMGGSGKTTLVAKVYKNQKVKTYFDCYAWITVSQTYVIEDLFRSMMEEFLESNKEKITVDLSTMSYRRLVETLGTYLQQKRYVVVLDDVWDHDLWSRINVALPDGGRGSRILLTTRKEDIASFSFGGGSHVHHIQPLQEGEAWDLFCKKAFPSDPSTCCPPGTEGLTRYIVKKCGGLPLAVVAVGGLMSSKNRTESEWRRVYESLNWELSNNPRLEAVKTILLLSYNDLPYYLKHCFLYCCVFPEDYLIKRKKLIRLWVAEGFVSERGDMPIEEVAETYFMELISRSILQVVERNHHGRPSSCRMHDLMRELALSTSERENFCKVYDERGRREGCRARRLSIQNKSNVINIQSHVAMSQVRSFFVFRGNMIPPSSCNGLLAGFKLLRVLDLEGVPIENVPDEFSELFNLRYLNLRNTKVKDLPKNFWKLQNLQTLDLKGSKVEALPKGIGKLQSLRHLIMYRTPDEAEDYSVLDGTQVPVDVCKLENLQVLVCIEATQDIIKQVGNMTRLTKIGITKVGEADGTELCTSIQKLKLLHGLSVVAINEKESLRMDALESPPPRLGKLGLHGKLDKVPLWFRSLENLTYLYLHWSRLREDPLPYIDALPNLGHLILSNAYDGHQLCFGAGSFPKLTRLRLKSLPQLNKVTISKGAMPNIEMLYLRNCRKLKMIPEGIKHLTNLQKLLLYDASEGLVDRMRGEKGVDHPQVQHIPEIKHFLKIKDAWFYESLSSPSVRSS